MWRTIWLIFRNEMSLLRRDRAALFMLFLAPMVIIAVAGFSLTNLFGARPADRNYLLPVVDLDHGQLANAIIKALSRRPAIEVVKMNALARARQTVLRSARAPLLLLIPAGATAAFDSGGTVTIAAYVDPVKRLQASAVEAQLNAVSRQLAGTVRGRERRDLVQHLSRLRDRLKRLRAQLGSAREAMESYRRQFARAQITARRDLRAEIARRTAALEAQTQASVEDAIALARERLARSITRKSAALAAVASYLRALRSSEAEFDRWLQRLRTAAGSYASEIPPPPHLPAPPSHQQLAELTQPLAMPSFTANFPKTRAPRLEFHLPAAPSIPRIKFDLPQANFKLPAGGEIQWRSRSLASGAIVVNAFDQYVPGFGVTFLLIDMLWGMSVGLVDEREWGTLQRLRASGAPVSGMLVGKLTARSLIGFVQMVVLFGIGWLLFRISLGRSAATLLLPAAAIAFCAAAFGLVIACIAPSRDSVLPIGSVAAMAMSAVGGCWWPLGFEPRWMRGLALAMPTTWTMRAFNNLMIRGLPPWTALQPAAVTFGLGLIFLTAGVIGSPRLYR